MALLLEQTCALLHGLPNSFSILWRWSLYLLAVLFGIHFFSFFVCVCISQLSCRRFVVLAVISFVIQLREAAHRARLWFTCLLTTLLKRKGNRSKGVKRKIEKKNSHRQDMRQVEESPYSRLPLHFFGTVLPFSSLHTTCR